MLKNLIYSVGLLTFLSNSVSATTLVIPVENEFTAEEQKVIYQYLHDYSWPIAKEIKSNPTSLAEYRNKINSIKISNPNHQAPEEEYLKEGLSHKLDKKFQLKQIPTTLWDLAFIEAFLESKKENTASGFSAVFPGSEKAVNSWQEEEKIGQYFSLSKKIWAKISGGEKIDYKEMVKSTLASIIKVGDFDKRQYAESLKEEQDSIEENRPSLLLSVMEAELEAMKNNQALLLRGTGGVIYKKGQLIDHPLKKDIEALQARKQLALNESLKELNKVLNKEFKSPLEAKKWLLNNEGAVDMENQTIKDFKKYFREFPNDPKPIEEIEHALDFSATFNSENDQATLSGFLKTTNSSVVGKTLNYGYSLLAGYINDGLSTWLGTPYSDSACVFSYHLVGAKYTYGILLDKYDSYLNWGKWLSTGSTSLAHEGIYGAGENFHAILKYSKPTTTINELAHFMKQTIGNNMLFAVCGQEEIIENERLLTRSRKQIFENALKDHAAQKNLNAVLEAILQGSNK